MGAGESRPCRFREALTAAVARRRCRADDAARRELFETLVTLERRALAGGASDATLRDIAEARFLAGILREAVRPVRRTSLRAVLRAREAARA